MFVRNFGFGIDFNSLVKKGKRFAFFVECNGTYGKNCVHNCSGNCLNDSPCNTQTGHCDMGCKPGYTNVLCNERKLLLWTNYVIFDVNSMVYLDQRIVGFLVKYKYIFIVTIILTSGNCSRIRTNTL